MIKTLGPNIKMETAPEQGAGGRLPLTCDAPAGLQATPFCSYNVYNVYCEHGYGTGRARFSRLWEGLVSWDDS